MAQAPKKTVEVTSLVKGILNGCPGHSAMLREDLKANVQVSHVCRLSYLYPTFQDSNFGKLSCLDKIISD